MLLCICMFISPPGCCCMILTFPYFVVCICFLYAQQNYYIPEQNTNYGREGCCLLVVSSIFYSNIDILGWCNVLTLKTTTHGQQGTCLDAGIPR